MEVVRLRTQFGDRANRVSFVISSLSEHSKNAVPEGSPQCVLQRQKNLLSFFSSFILE